MGDLAGWAVTLLVLVALYAAFLGLLFATGRRAAVREAALLLPNLGRLFHGLLRDRAVPWHAKVVIALGIGYLATPLDLVPDVIPVVGTMDDAIVASLVLGYVLRTSGPVPLQRHWHGDPRILRRIVSLARGDVRQRVLFLCIRNSARSQMAEGLLRSLAPDRFDVASAGITAGSLRPEATQVMREIGIDISGQRSKSADEYAGQPFDVLVTTCDEAREVCPLFPTARRMLHWSIADPVFAAGDDQLAGFRSARDELRARIEEELLPR